MKGKDLIIIGLCVSILFSASFNIYNAYKSVKTNIDIASTQESIPKNNPVSPIDYNAMAELINIKRAESDSKKPLMINQVLNHSAQLKANDMASKGYWGHKDLNGEMPWKFFRASSYEYAQAGENLARCYSTAEAVVEAWYESPLHRHNILGNFSEIGFGTSYNENGCLMIVNHFGRTE